MLIGLGYKKRSGKDTVAQMLKEMYGFKILSFAEPLKELCQFMVDRNNRRMDQARYDVLVHTWGRKYGLPASSETMNYLLYERFPSHLFEEEAGKPRRLLQFVGTDLIRGYSDSFWIDAMKKRLPHRPIGRLFTVIPDVRFQNEKDFIEAYGEAVLVSRETGLSDSHSSENDLDKAVWCYEINNNGTLEELREQVKELFSETLHLTKKE